jgi:hypothetical protein
MNRYRAGLSVTTVFLLYSAAALADWHQLALAEHMDSKHQLLPVADYMSTAVTQLSTTQLSELKKQVEQAAP